MSDLGDIGNFLKDGSLTDLSWLDVDENEYRKNDTLPRQNLDIVPDLEALWDHEDKPSTAYLEPNTGAPRTMGDLSQVHGHLRSSPADIVRATKFAMMQTTDASRIAESLKQRFDESSLKVARRVIAEVLSERGLLGNIYVEASDFSKCSSGIGTEVAQKTEAPYVVAKPECVECVHARKTATGLSCATFHKEIVVNVPWSEALAEKTEKAQRAKGKDVKEASDRTPKERVRLAVLASNVCTGKALEVKPVLDPSRHLRPVTAVQAVARPKTVSPVLETVRRELLKGRGQYELARALKLAFDKETLEKTRSEWEPSIRLAGVFGVAYITQESFADCQEGADFLSRHNPGVKHVVTGSKCNGCFHNKVSRCLLYGKSLVRSVKDAVTSDVATAVLRDRIASGHLDPMMAHRTWPSDPSEALRAIHAAVEKGVENQRQVQRAFVGAPRKTTAEEIVRETPVVKMARRYLNEGLYGDQLLEALRTHFTSSDLVASGRGLKVVLANQGLQGIHYVDPTMYEDYGRGCDEASRLHRSRLVPVVQAGSKCAGCVLQTRPGYCSKLNKDLVPSIEMTSELRELRKNVLASGQATETRFENLMNNGSRTVLEFEMSRRAMDVEVDPALIDDPISIALGTGEIKL
jgi:hypothetical protein